MVENTKIIVCYHKESEIFETDSLMALHVGKSEHPDVLTNIIGDNTGENISIKNSSYCELTGMYWLWKNIEANNYGLFHYRRFLDIKNKYDKKIAPEEINLNDYNKESFDELMTKFDIIIPKKLVLKENLYEHYKNCHEIKDLDSVINVIKEKYPDYLPATNEVMKDNKGIFCNMFIMKKELFNEYCTWLFDILESVEKQISTSGYNSYQKRVIGFLSERLFSVFVHHKQKSNPKIRIMEAETIFIDPDLIKKIKFLFGNLILYKKGIDLNILGLKIKKSWK